MKKQIILFLSIITVRAAISGNNVVVSNLCELINERTYFLQRLEKLITTIKHADVIIDIPIPECICSDFQHPLIRDMIHSIQNSRSITPFFSAWDALIHYKKIDDPSLIREFTKFTLFLVKSIYTSINDTKKIFDTSQDYDFVFNTATMSYTESITLRFYYAQRLKIAIGLLSSIRCHRDSFFEFSTNEKGCNCIFSSKVQFKHKEIISCIASMEKSSNLEPLIALAHEFSTYRLIRDELFTKEFILLILCIYKNLAVNNMNIRNHQTLALEKIVMNYETIQSLPLEQILATIDILTNELPQLLQHYHFYSYKSWKRWLKKYWWVPPVVVITIAARIGLQFKKRPHFGSLRW